MHRLQLEAQPQPQARSYRRIYLPRPFRLPSLVSLLLEVVMERQTFPDSQKEPLGPKQREYVEKLGRAFFRDGQPSFVPCVCPMPEQKQ